MKLLKFDIAIILGLLALFSSYPYIFECLVSIPHVSVTGPIFMVVGLLILMLTKNRRFLYHNVMVLWVCLQMVLWLLYFVIHSDSTYISRVFFVFYTLSIVLCLARRGQLLKFVKIHSWIMGIMAIGALLAFILVFAGILQPLSYFSLQDGRFAASYGLTCTNSVFGNVIRTAGFFDEPGAFAFWGIYALVFNRLFIKNRYLEYFLIIGLLTSLSAAYFVQLPLYVGLFYVLSKTTKNRLLYVLLIAISVALLYNYSKEDDIIARYTTERFENGEIQSKRVDYTENAKRVFLNSPIIGNGANNVSKKGELEDNPYEILAKDGILGFIIIYMPLFIPFILTKNKEILFATIILFAGYLQRPFHINLMHFFHLYVFCLLSYQVYGSKKINMEVRKIR